MKVFVYGTLKRGYGNGKRLLEPTSTFISEHIIDGYKLLDSGFPVAAPSPNSKVKGEIWDIGDSDSVLNSLDRLEGEGWLYSRKEIEPDLFMYVGIDRAFRFDSMREIPHTNNVYEWSR